MYENKELEHWLREGLNKGYTPGHLKKILIAHGFQKESDQLYDVYSDLYIAKKYPEKKNISPWLTLLALAFGTVLAALDKSVVNLAMPEMIKFFGVTLSTASWVATVYILTSAIFVPVWGKLGSRFGHRKIFLIGFVGFIITSALTGISWNIFSLITFRAMQGLAGAAVYPTAMSLITKNFHDKKARAQALGVWSALAAASFALGPLVGGPLIDYFSWRSVFFINFPVGIIGLFMVIGFVPKDLPEEIGKFDLIGAILLCISIFSLIFVLDRGLDWGWLSSQSILFYSVFILFGILFLAYERVVSNPIVDIGLFKSKVFSSVLGATLVSQGVFAGALLVVSLFAQQHLGFSATKTGYLFLFPAFGYVLFSLVGVKMAHKFSPRIAISVGMAISAVGIYLFHNINNNSTFWDFIPAFMIVSLGLGLGTSPLTTSITSAVPKHEVGIASGLLNLTRNLSGVFGIALMSTLISLNISYERIFFIASLLFLAGAFISLLITESAEDYEGVDRIRSPEVPAIME